MLALSVRPSPVAKNVRIVPRAAGEDSEFREPSWLIAIGKSAGAVPGGVGVLQVNARVPGGFVPPGAAAVALAVGNFAAPAATFWLK